MAKSKAESVPYTHPSFDIIHQVDFTIGNPSDPDTNIHKFGCRFMCEMAICQFIAGHALTKSDILKVYAAATSGAWGDNVMASNCAVGANEAKLMEGALTILGDTKHRVQQVMVKDVSSGGGDWNVDKYNASQLPGKGNVYFVIVDMLTNSGSEYGGHHFVLFNPIGELIYDPARGTVKCYKGVNRLLFYKVFNKN